MNKSKNRAFFKNFFGVHGPGAAQTKNECYSSINRNCINILVSWGEITINNTESSMGMIENDNAHRTIINDAHVKIIEHSKHTLANQIERVDEYFRQALINSPYSVWQINAGNKQDISIDAGDGRNTINVYGGNNVDVYSGGGDDIINVSSATGHVTINAGDGDNSVDVWGGEKVKISSGSGDDIINVGSVSSATGHVIIDSGAGDDIINITAGAKTAHVLAGEGHNKVNVANVWDTVNIKSGSGNDSIEVNSQHKQYPRSHDVVVDAGHGNNKIDIRQAVNVKVRSGRGNDIININENRDHPWHYPQGIVDVDAGDGRNFVNIFSFASAVSVATGSGDDRISVTNAGRPYGYWGSGDRWHAGNKQDVSIDAGDGRNTINVYGGNNVDVYSGGGDDIINVSSATGHVTINAGDGDNSVDVWGGEKVKISSGSGDDIINVGSVSSATGHVIIDSGAGDDNIYIFNSKNVTVNGGSGNDHIWLTECYSSNTIIFRTGSGHDYVHNSIGWNYDKLEYDYQSTILLSDLNLNDIIFKTTLNQIIDTRTGMLVQTFDLLITIRSTGETLHYEHAFFKDKQLWDFNGLHFIKFADGTVWTMEQIADTISSTLDSNGNVLETYCNLKNDPLNGISNYNKFAYSDSMNNQPYSNVGLGILSSNLNSDNDKKGNYCRLNEGQSNGFIFCQNQIDQLVHSIAGLVTQQGAVGMWHSETKDDLYYTLSTPTGKISY